MPPYRTAESYLNTLTKRYFVRFLRLLFILVVVWIVSVLLAPFDIQVLTTFMVVTVAVIYGGWVFRRVSNASYGMRVEQQARNYLNAIAGNTWIVRHDVPAPSRRGNIDHVLIHTELPLVIIIETKAFRTVKQDTTRRQKRMHKAFQQIATIAGDVQHQIHARYGDRCVVLPVLWLPMGPPSHHVVSDSVVVVSGWNIMDAITHVYRCSKNPGRSWGEMRNHIERMFHG